MLQSFSAVELSRHAIELEKRPIQLSLEEARSSSTPHKPKRAVTVPPFPTFPRPPNLASNPQPLLSPWINNQTPVVQPLSAAIFHKHTVITVPTFILSIPAIATLPKHSSPSFSLFIIRPLS
ncbi:hypothetical protein NC651_028442 [Populus alba x Populus x berolinensis]|nr:hypothetical protein NC651_028442 [Populus alba x Populus x berolinensis]